MQHTYNYYTHRGRCIHNIIHYIRVIMMTSYLGEGHLSALLEVHLAPGPEPVTV